MIQEALKLVDSLNTESYLDGVNLEWLTPFTFESDGKNCAISFMEVQIWDNENDGREWREEDEQEPLKDFVIREAKKILADLNIRLAQI